MKGRILLGYILLFLCSIAFDVLATPDLVGLDGRLYGIPSDYFYVQPSSFKAGDQVTVSLYVANFGNSAAGASHIRLYLSKSSTINPASDYALTEHIAIPSLNVNGYAGGTVTVKIPAQNVINSLGGPGSFTIGMVVDSLNEIVESNEGNNLNTGTGKDLASVTVSIPLPDLAGFNGATSYPDAYFGVLGTNLTWGDSIRLHLAFQNLTGGNAGPFNVKVYLSPDSSIGDAGDYLILNYTNSSGLAGLTYNSLDATVSLPSVNPFGGTQTNFYVGMVVDADNQVAESNESNNRNLGNGIDRATAIICNPFPVIFVTDSVLPGDDRLVPFADVADDGAGNARGVQTITIINKGKGTLNIANLALTGSPYFSLQQIASSIQNFIPPSSLPRTIAKNGTESWTLTLQFDPATNGPATGALTITSDDPATPSLAISLTGNGVPVPKIALTTPEAAETDFGSVVQDGAGGFQSTRTISLKNTGTGPLTVSQNGISLLTGTQFSVVSVTSSTQGAINLATGSRTIAARGAEIWNVVVRFDPTTLGQINDGLSVASNDPNQPLFTASLRGKGLNAMHLQVKDSTGTSNIVALAFPGVHADGPGKQQATTTITLRNSGEAPLTVPSNGLTFTNGTHFHLGGIVSDKVGTIDLTTGPKQLAGTSNETWTVTLIFDPATGGALNDRLSIASDDLASPSVAVALSGQGIVRPALIVTDSVAPTNDLSIPFGSVLNDGPGGRDARQTVTLIDIGAQPLILAQNGLSLSGGAGFSIVSVISSTRGPVDVSSANPTDRTMTTPQLTVTAVFPATPVSPGGLLIYSGTVRNTGNITLTDVVVVSDQPAANTPLIGPMTLAPGASANFISAYGVPANAFSVTTTISGTGMDPYTLNTVTNTVATTCASTTAPCIAVTQASPPAPNEIWTVTLAFDPTANGPSAGTLGISSNDTNQPIVHVSLTATGATPAITLTTPALPLNVSAGSVFNFAWQYAYPSTNAVLALYLDTDANPANGLIPIATGISADAAGSS